jgi:hypothetical protein
MVKLPTARPAVAPKTNDSKKIAWVYAVVLLINVVLQIFDFKGFVDVIISFWPHHQRVGATVAGVIPFAEIFALPFLLRMRLSIGFRVFSMFLGWLVPAIWLFISIWTMSDNSVVSVGVLGAHLTVTPGIWVVFLSAALAVLSIWTSWGLWPFHIVAKKRHTARH